MPEPEPDTETQTKTERIENMLERVTDFYFIPQSIKKRKMKVWFLVSVIPFILICMPLGLIFLHAWLACVITKQLIEWVMKNEADDA